MGNLETPICVRPPNQLACEHRVVLHDDAGEVQEIGHLNGAIAHHAEQREPSHRRNSPVGLCYLPLPGLRPVELKERVLISRRPARFDRPEAAYMANMGTCGSGDRSAQRQRGLRAGFEETGHWSIIILAPSGRR
jgi:hypothetical protein